MSKSQGCGKRKSGTEAENPAHKKQSTEKFSNLFASISSLLPTVKIPKKLSMNKLRSLVEIVNCNGSVNREHVNSLKERKRDMDLVNDTMPAIVIAPLPVASPVVQSRFTGLHKIAASPSQPTSGQLMSFLGHLPFNSAAWTTSDMQAIVNAMSGVACVRADHGPGDNWYAAFRPTYTALVLANPEFALLVDPVSVMVDLTRGGTRPLVKPRNYHEFLNLICDPAHATGAALSVIRDTAAALVAYEAKKNWDEAVKRDACRKSEVLELDKVAESERATSSNTPSSGAAEAEPVPVLYGAALRVPLLASSDDAATMAYELSLANPLPVLPAENPPTDHIWLSGFPQVVGNSYTNFTFSGVSAAAIAAGDAAYDEALLLGGEAAAAANSTREQVKAATALHHQMCDAQFLGGMLRGRFSKELSVSVQIWTVPPYAI